MSVRSLYERWSISPAHAYQIIAEGLLPGTLRIAGAIRVPIAAVEEYERRGDGVAPPIPANAK